MRTFASALRPAAVVQSLRKLGTRGMHVLGSALEPAALNRMLDELRARLKRAYASTLRPAAFVYSLHKLRTSFWLVPACFGIGAWISAVVFLWIDSRWTAAALADFGAPFTFSLDTARQLLATLAGAMVTVVGLVFSMTLVSLTLAAGNLGVRLLERYMRNQVTHVTMGLFVGSFVFVCIVLSGLDVIGEDLPRLSIGIALLLSTLSVIWLGFAFHDLAIRLQIDQEAAQIAKTLVTEIERAARPLPGWSADATGDAPPILPGYAIEAGATGYIQTINLSVLAEIVAEPGATLRLMVRQGDHVIPHDRVAILTGPPDMIEKIRPALGRAIAIGAKRTSTDDLLFHVHLLLEITARALSPGINDRYTAANCIDHLTACIAHAARVRLTRHHLRHEDGSAAVVTCTPDLVDLVDTVFSALRQDISGDPILVVQTVRNIARLTTAGTDERAIDRLHYHLDALLAASERHMTDAADRTMVAAAAQQVTEARDRLAPEV